MRWPRFTLKATFWAVAVIAVGLAAFAECAHRLPLSLGYRLTAHYDQLPPDDKPLEAWLRAQPGVVDRTVHVERNGADLLVWFIMSRPVAGDPPIPDLSRICDQLGYAPLSYWTDAD